MSRTDALKAAEDAGLDLVEISPQATPPVAKIIDWGKYQYQKMKEQQRNKKRARVSELKQIRLGMKIGQHDLDIKLKKVQSFLEDGDKVRIQLMYRGRENAHQELGFGLMDRIITAMGEEVIVEQKPQINGRNLSMIIRSK
jgi:translation initiation factor IF-3